MFSLHGLAFSIASTHCLQESINNTINKLKTIKTVQQGWQKDLMLAAIQYLSISYTLEHRTYHRRSNKGWPAIRGFCFTVLIFLFFWGGGGGEMRKKKNV